MPPAIKISKEKIIDNALKIVSKEGMEGLNARKLAKVLNCSVQPIYYQFANMDELKLGLIKYAYEDYKRYIYSAKKSNTSYLKSGISYIKFAKEKPNLFNLLFMIPQNVKVEDPNLDYIYQLVMEKTGLSLEKTKEFHFSMWVYVHGIATMIYTNIIDFKMEEIEKLLIIQYEALVWRYKQ